MFRFGLMRDVAERPINKETGVVSSVPCQVEFTACVDLETGEAYWEGQNKTPFKIAPELLAWCKDQ